MLKTLFVVDEAGPLSGSELSSVSFTSYLHDYPKRNELKVRVINLCDSRYYLSQGYYCSLLAEARNHQVLPSVKVINELRNSGAKLWLEESLLQKALSSGVCNNQIIVCMGLAEDADNQKIAQRAYQEFAAPILSVTLNQQGSEVQMLVEQVPLVSLDSAQLSFCLSTLEDYSKKRWRSQVRGKKYRWEMAILYDPDEDVPPSNKGAIKRFVKAGEKIGIRTHVGCFNDIHHLNQYDALFIRETTAIDHHTYRLARQAENLDLVLIDDASSILRCCNKVFLHDAFQYKHVPHLLTQIITDITTETILDIEQKMEYPMVLKMPEGSFSRGVFKVSTRGELIQRATDMFRQSAVLLVQEFLQTEFDWRIGVLNGRAFYACRYYMAKNHWQIYNHGSKRFFSGGFDALPTFEVPALVLRAAMKAASVVGDGLYGIDIKESKGDVYVLEVNDNPSIDHGVEDAYLGEELYMQIMSEFLRRLETRGL